MTVMNSCEFWGKNCTDLEICKINGAQHYYTESTANSRCHVESGSTCSGDGQWLQLWKISWNYKFSKTEIFGGTNDGRGAVTNSAVSRAKWMMDVWHFHLEMAHRWCDSFFPTSGCLGTRDRLAQSSCFTNKTRINSNIFVYRSFM